MTSLWALSEPYQPVLPLNLEGLVPDDDSVRLLSHELEKLDYSLLYQAYSAKGRNPAVDPKTMFKILTYAYSRNIYSSSKLEACANKYTFVWKKFLLCLGYNLNKLYGKIQNGRTGSHRILNYNKRKCRSIILY